MKCEQAIQMMNAFVDGELNELELKKLTQHMDSCESCTVEFEEIKYLVQLMGEMDLKELPMGFEEELHAKLVYASNEMHASQELASDKHNNIIGNWLSAIKNIKIKRSYFAIAAVPLVMVIVVLASKNFLMGASKNESAVMDMDGAYEYGIVEETRAAVMMPEVSDENSLKSSVMFSESEEASGFTGVNAGTTDSQSNDYRDGRLIIQTASINMDVEKYDLVLADLKNRVIALGGYVENESTSFKTYYSETDNLKYGYVTVRVPSTGYDSILTQIKEMGLVTMESSNANDITKMYRDTASEIENLKVTEARLREIMLKAVEIEDILAIENEMTRIRGSINAYEKQIQDWEALVDMATITVSLNEVKNLKPVVEPIDDSLFGKAKEGFINSINAIKRAIENLVIWIVAKSPFLLLLAVVAVIASLIYKKRRPKK